MLVELWLAQGRVLETIEQVVADRLGEVIGILSDIGDPPAGHGRGHILDVATADADRTAGGMNQTGKQKSHLLLAAAAGADDGDVLIDLGGEADPVQQLEIVLVEEGDRRDGQIAFQRRSGLVADVLDLRIEDRGRLELLDHLVVLDLHVVAPLVPVDQLLDRAGQILVGGDHGDQSADVEMAENGQHAATGIEDEGRELGQQVVEELDEKLALIDLEADIEDPGQA